MAIWKYVVFSYRAPRWRRLVKVIIFFGSAAERMNFVTALKLFVKKYIKIH